MRIFSLTLFVALLLAGSAWSQSVISSTSFDSQPIWAEWDYGSGDTVLLVSAAGTLYRSTAGAAFTNQASSIPDWTQINSPFGRAGLRVIMATNDPNKVYFVGFSNIWVTYNAGATYVKRPYDPNVIISSILPHPYNSDMAIMNAYTMSCYSADKSSCNNRLYLTSDFGQTWRLISTYVSRYRWAANANSQLPRIYASVYTTKSGNQLALAGQDAELVLTDDFFSSTRLLLSNVSSFAIKGPFVDAAYHNNGVAELWTSGNYGKSFVHFPAPDWAYALVLTPFVSSQTIFMMPASQLPSQNMYGQTWHSDVTGANFVRSTGAMSVLSSGVEFHYDELIPGVFFANFASLGATGSVVRHTMVSRNNGGVWQHLMAPVVDANGSPTNCAASSGCYLHLVLAINQPGSFVTNPTSPGVIITRGNYGQVYDPSPLNQNTYISSDAGSTWREILKGSQTTAIAEYGALIVAAPLIGQTSSVKYSYDQGATWQSFALPAPDYMLAVVASPANNTGVFLLIGSQRAYFLNFPDSSVRACNANDFYTWSPVDPEGRPCLLGTSWIVTSRRPQSACVPSSPPAPIRFSSSCSCSSSDYECAFGYALQPPAVGCVPLASPTRSPAPANTRRISGDACSASSRDISIIN